MSRLRAHGVLGFFPPLLFYCPTPHPLATHTHIPCRAYTLDNTRNDLSPAVGEGQGLETLPENQHSQVAFLPHIPPHLPCYCLLPPLKLANGPLWERNRVCLNSISVLSAATALLRPPQAAALAVRYASKKTGGSSKNLGGKSPGKRFGIKKMEGEGVPLLSFPSCTLSWAPGVPLKSRKTWPSALRVAHQSIWLQIKESDKT